MIAARFVAAQRAAQRTIATATPSCVGTMMPSTRGSVAMRRLNSRTRARLRVVLRRLINTSAPQRVVADDQAAGPHEPQRPVEVRRQRFLVGVEEHRVEALRRRAQGECRARGRPGRRCDRSDPRARCSDARTARASPRSRSTGSVRRSEGRAPYRSRNSRPACRLRARDVRRSWSAAPAAGGLRPPKSKSTAGLARSASSRSDANSSSSALKRLVM